jgi:hypothetical protein
MYNNSFKGAIQVPALRDHFTGNLDTCNKIYKYQYTKNISHKGLSIMPYLVLFNLTHYETFSLFYTYFAFISILPIQ